MDLTITVFYSCRLCGLEKIPCKVPARKDDQGVLDWTEQMMGTYLSNHHSALSPGCHPTHLQDVMIPIDGAEMIGGPSIQ